MFALLIAIHFHFNTISEIGMIWIKTAVPTSTYFQVHSPSYWAVLLGFNSKWSLFNSLIPLPPLFGPELQSPPSYSWLLWSLAASSGIGECLQGKSSSKHMAYSLTFLQPQILALQFFTLLLALYIFKQILSTLSSFSVCPHWSKLYSFSLTQVKVLRLLLKNSQTCPQQADPRQWSPPLDEACIFPVTTMSSWSLLICVSPVLLAFGIETLALNSF